MIEEIFDNNKIYTSHIENFVADSFPMGADYSDLYFQYSISESWILEDGIVKGGSYNISNGVGTNRLWGKNRFCLY